MIDRGIMFKIIIGYMKPYTKKIVLMTLFNILSGACALGIPFVMSNIVNIGIKNGNMQYIFVQGAIMLVLALSMFGTAMANNKLTSVVSAQFSSSMRKRVVDKVNTLTAEQFNSVGTGSLITRSTDDIGWLEESLIMLPYVAVTFPVMLVGAIVMTAIADWVLALILLALTPIVMGIVLLIMRGMGTRWEIADKYIDEQNRIVRERLSGIRVIRAFDKDEVEHQRAATATLNMTKKFIHNNTLSGIVSPITMFLLNIATVAIVYIGINRMQTVSWLQAGDIIAILQYIALMANAILMLSWTLALLPHIKVTVGRVQQVLDLPEIVEEQQQDIVVGGTVKMDNVTFTYPNATASVLNNINIDIADGEIVGIIGGTGSGKTTILKTLLAFYPQIEGQLYLGGHNYTELGSKCVRDNLAVALQKSMVFQGTIRDNVTMGNSKATQEQLDKVISIAQLKDFVDSHQEGLDYMLKQSGSNISGGQKQRINIARTILKEASVYIFDDSFSALDYLTEAKLRKALNKHLKGKTQIIVTQRAATAMRCDKVYVMDKGRIVGYGTHKQLLGSCPLYKEICDSQLGGSSNVR